MFERIDQYIQSKYIRPSGDDFMDFPNPIPIIELGKLVMAGVTVPYPNISLMTYR